MKTFAICVTLLLGSVSFAQTRFVTTVAGVPGVSGAHDGASLDATFQRPSWIDVVTAAVGHDGASVGDIFVIDRANRVLRKVSNGQVTTASVVEASWSPNPLSFDFGGPLGGGILIEPPDAGCGGGIYGRGIFVVNSGKEQIDLIAMGADYLASRDDISSIIGSGLQGWFDGDSTLAQFHTPTGIGRSWIYPNFNDVRQRHVYIADTGNHVIRRVSYFLSFEACPQHRVIDTMAGAGGEAGWRDGRGSEARFSSPRGVVGAPDGNVYVTDSGNHVIRRITPDGVVTTIAGEPGVRGMNDGPALQGHFDTPSGIDVDFAGNLYIADTGNGTIRMLSSDGRLTTIAGVPHVGGFRDGPAETALFNGPVGIRVDADGSILVADTSNNVIRRIVEVREPRRRPVRH